MMRGLIKMVHSGNRFFSPSLRMVSVFLQVLQKWSFVPSVTQQNTLMVVMYILSSSQWLQLLVWVLM